jgi:hypothetical protein
VTPRVPFLWMLVELREAVSLSAEGSWETIMKGDMATEKERADAATRIATKISALGPFPAAPEVDLIEG